MPIFVDKDDQFHHDHGQHFALACPTCAVFSHITPMSTPRYAELMRYKPADAGIVYRCDSCNSPVFLKFPVKAYTPERVELSSNYQEIERPTETFDFTYLPEETETLFREALTCYSQNTLNAFASMCRRTIGHLFADLGDVGRMRVFEQCNDIRQIADVDEETFDLVRKVLFDTDGSRDSLPILNSAQAGVLLEFMRDILYESYVRKGKLQQAMMMRRFFADEPGEDESGDGGQASSSRP